MRKEFVVKSFLFLVFGLFSIAALLYPAIQNGYPLLYSDSASYICSGHDGVVPIDRPIVYGLIVRHVSMSFSLWFVVIFQAAVFFALTWFTVRVLFRRERAVYYTTFVCLLTGFLTGASNYISQIMPDIFTGYMIWSVALLMLPVQQKMRWIIWGVALISATVHYSNLMTLSVIALLLLLVNQLWKHWLSPDRLLKVQLGTLIVIPWIILLVINFAYEREFFINRSTPVFLTGRLIETGLVHQYLTNYPEAKQDALYPYKDQLPEKIWQFVWNDDSPLYNDSCLAQGWVNCWLYHADEYRNTIRSILSKPELLSKFIRICFSDWIKQLSDFNIGHLTQQGANSALSDIITHYFDDAPMFRQSKQFNEDLFFTKESRVQHYAVLCSIILLGILLWITCQPHRKKLLFILAVILAGMVLNAFFCSSLSGVLNRYQGRVVWLLPWIAIVVIISFAESIHQKKQHAGKEAI